MKRLLLHRLEMEGQGASFRGRIGPILDPDAGNLHACGSGYSLTLLRGSDDAWQVVEGLILDC